MQNLAADAEITGQAPRNRHERRAVAAAHDLGGEPAAWRINDWRRRVPMSRTKFYQERGAGRIETVKLGSSTLVTTPPKDYIAALRSMPEKAA